MKILIIVERDPREPDVMWLAEAADETTLKGWNGELPTTLQRAIDGAPGNTRKLWIEIPDDAYAQAFGEITTTGKVVSE